MAHAPFFAGFFRPPWSADSEHRGDNNARRSAKRLCDGAQKRVHLPYAMAERELPDR